jgi:S1-C subfamily serine protease
MIKQVLKLTLIIIAAAAVGVYANQVLWPRYVEQPLFSKLNIEQEPVQVVERQQTTIVENTALVSTIDQVAKTEILVKSTSSKGTAVSGAGLVLTSDGLAVASADLLPLGGKFEVLANGKNVNFTVVKRDPALGIVLIKINDVQGMSTSSFYELENLKIGTRIFLLGNSGGQNFVNEGVVRSFDDTAIQTTIIEKSVAAGSPVFDIG